MTKPANWPTGKYGAIYADPPWRFEVYSLETSTGSNPDDHYPTMTTEDICALPVAGLAAEHCALFLWGTWPRLPDALATVAAWGFTYKTVAFVWTKLNQGSGTLFLSETDAFLGPGYWTRSNTEYCLLATKGSPKRLDGGVRQVVLARRREHSRKPDEVPGRIESLVVGPYMELFARTTRPGWSAWGNQTDKFAAA